MRCALIFIRYLYFPVSSLSLQKKFDPNNAWCIIKAEAIGMTVDRWDELIQFECQSAEHR